jgi:hypothetical protein
MQGLSEEDIVSKIQEIAPNYRNNEAMVSENESYNEIVEIIGEEVYNKFHPEIFEYLRDDVEANLRYVIQGRPLNRYNPNGKTVISEIPTVSDSTPRRTLSEVCDISASNILELSNSKTIFLMWSGGIDSTLALYCISELGMPFNIVMDNNSELEYPSLAESIRDGSFNSNIQAVVYSPTVSEYKALISDTSNVFVTGGNGDEVLGGDNTCVGEVEHADEYYGLYVPQDIQDYTDEYVSRLVGDMSEMTVCEWRWSINFIYKYQQSQTSPMFMLGLGGIPEINNCYAFYDIIEFQEWAVINYKYLCTSKNKQEAKELIVSKGGDASYLEKGKVCSMKSTRYIRDKDFW